MGSKTAFITGSTSGIGKATAIALGKAGYNLILTGRNDNTGNKIAKKIQKNFNVQADFIKADISSLNEVKLLAEKIKNKYTGLDVLVNNAGARFDTLKKSKDDIELTFATNYLGHFLLTLSLLDLLKNTANARIINVSSSAHSGSNFNLNNIVNPKTYNRKKAYGDSKLAQIFFTYKLSKKVNQFNITVNAVHPGGVATNIARNNGIIAWSKHYVSYILKGALISPSKAAETIDYLATSNEVDKITGKYFNKKVMVKSSDISYDLELSDKLWAKSLELCELNEHNIFTK
jgi:NAD(P)-dependent dehydrogenase (short-subunit alcohol dehydrogenase family)